MIRYKWVNWMEKVLDKNILLYMHAGSGNHGCEAIVSSLADIMQNAGMAQDGENDKKEMTLLSYRAAEDEKYTLSGKCNIVNERSFDDHKLAHILYYIYRKITKDEESFIRYRYKGLINPEKIDIAVSIGGDNYCYDSMLKDLRLSNNAFKKAGIPTILLGCSIEPDLLKRDDIIDDLGNYSRIIARESITYNAIIAAFKEKGIPGDKVFLVPDPAFSLKTENIQDSALPKEFAAGNTVGINISPMIQSNEKIEGITITNYRKMISYILENTDMSVALIPHVVWANNDDRIPCHKLYEEYAKEYPGRVCEIGDCSASELKAYISRLRFFVGARTHSTIAAYSSLVPTLVVGYSVKAIGIAKDLFGTDENHVIPVQTLKEDDDLLDAARWLFEHEVEIKNRLTDIIPKIKEDNLMYKDILVVE